MENFIKFFKIIICLLLMIISVSYPHAQTLEQLKTNIENARVETGLTGLGIAIVDENGPVWVAGLGEADKTQKTPVTPDTLFRIGSISKMFVALSVLQLVEQGKLHLDDKLSDLAPEVYFDNQWEQTHPIRLVHLLEHTTGWDDVSFSVYANEDATISLKDALAFRPQYRQSRWVPGTRFAYNNAGPAVAAYIVQKVTGQPFEDYVQTHFFNPLHMNSATFFESDLYKKNGATLYSIDGSARDYWNIIIRPAGSINASIADMAKYLQFLIARGEYNQQRLLSEQSVTRMETPTTTLGAVAGTKAGYGLNNYATGFEQAGIAFRGHDGDVWGGHCRLSYIIELKLGYVLCINQDNNIALDKIQNLLRAYLIKGFAKASPTEIELPEKFKQLAGYYIPINSRVEQFELVSELTGAMRITVGDNRLHRMPVLGGWQSPSDDYAINENILVSRHTGLPTIAIVNDPLAGEVVEVSDGPTLKRVSAFWLMGMLGLIVCTLALGLSSLLFAPIWITRLLVGKLSRGATISIRLWPLITFLAPVITVCVIYLFGTMKTIGTISPVTLTIFICSSIYPLLAIYSLINVYKYRHEKINTLVYWHSAIFSIVHVCMAIMLAQYGMLMMRLWV
ncbi:serine hydrolase [Cellvibrio sp. UBA7661]|uniref:serine hydrolase domain-containing protein n=1 Tax=Cellvibrio sp. UBA7661 TaxID=1946311 RepID=UPI002F35C2CE